MHTYLIVLNAKRLTKLPLLVALDGLCLRREPRARGPHGCTQGSSLGSAPVRTLLFKLTLPAGSSSCPPSYFVKSVILLHFLATICAFVLRRRFLPSVWLVPSVAGFFLAWEAFFLGLPRLLFVRLWLAPWGSALVDLLLFFPVCFR